MAIFHLDLKGVSRRLGQSAVGTWAYISGTRQVDERTGRIYNRAYKAREVLAYGSEGSADWQACERAERRRDAKVARTIILALPHELGAMGCERLARRYARWLRKEHGMVVGWAIHHAPGDPRNIHLHLLLSTRVVDERGRCGRKLRELDRTSTSRAIIARWRKAWEEHVNTAMEAIESKSRIDCRSLAARGITRAPRQHLVLQL